MSLLGMSTLKLVVVGVVALGVAVGGAFAVGVIGTPSVVGVDNAFGEVDTEETVIETNLTVNNPNPIGVTLGGVTVDYGIDLNGISMANGTREGVPLERGNSTIAFETRMDNDRIPDWWVSHLRNGESTTLTVDADVHSELVGRSFDAPAVERGIDTDLAAAFDSTEDRELESDSPVVPDPILVIRETRGDWGAVDRSTTEIEMEFDVYNPREFPIALSEIGYDVAMNDVAMGNGSTEQEVVIPPDEERTLTATFRLNNRNLDEWWVSHLGNGQQTTLAADFYVRADLSEGGGGTVQVPLDTMERTIETDIFGEGESGSDGSDGETGDETTEEGGSATETPTDGTETPTDGTETPTDGTETPTDGTETPTDGTETPTDGTETPTEDDGVLSVRA